MAGIAGLEPATQWLTVICSTNWAIFPYVLEATPRFELGIKELQSTALPLGYVALLLTLFIILPYWYFVNTFLYFLLSFYRFFSTFFISWRWHSDLNWGSRRFKPLPYHLAISPHHLYFIILIFCNFVTAFIIFI